MSKEVYYVIGAMSGTSLDGLDMAFCCFMRKQKKWSYRILGTHYVDYDDRNVELLKEAYTCTARRLQEIDVEFGRFIGKHILEFIDRFDVPIDLIASHGHTVFHEPQNGYTLQVGSGAQIASITGVVTVCGFRDLDVALGGQGAPLVPIGDELLFGEYAACLNLGGFANISYSFEKIRVAYDICPLNFVLNRLSQKLGLPFDNNGESASKGFVNECFVEQLNSLEFYSQNPPKSLGQEWVEKEVIPLIEKQKDMPVENMLASYTKHAAQQIAKSLGHVLDDQILITGGGAYNNYLLELIRGFTKKPIIVPAKELIDFKEALVFAFLGVLRLQNDINTLASVTGAKKNSSGGVIYSP